jgi:gamma-glutamylcyclotransferase (GGCT)/AIG2-like uncharacterized protein YtfP
MEQLFAYGTLKNKDIQETIFGRILKGTPETLVSYIIKEIQIEEEFGLQAYPIIVQTQNKDNTIEGILYQISKQELLQSDIYEGKYYKRIEVLLQSNQKAWVYSANN